MSSIRHDTLGVVGILVFAVSGCGLVLGLNDFSEGTPDGGGGSAKVPPDASPDTTPTLDSSTCTPMCVDGSTLDDCSGATTACAFDCVTEGGAHCTAIYPTSPVLPSDMRTAGTSEITISLDTRFDTDTGAIDNLRPVNTDPLKMEVHGGIGFRIGKGSAGQSVGVWTFKNLTIPSGITVHFDETHAAALIATDTISVLGIIDARGYDAAGSLCKDNAAGPGGGLGGLPDAAGQGPGQGNGPSPSGTFSGGPAGGGFGGLGGKGGKGSSGMGTTAGVAYGTLELSPLLGGSGGGGGGVAGGGGGGAIQLVAGVKIFIGGGPIVGGINAGGCNGHGGTFGAPGSAGGSGGAILVEAPSFNLLANGVLAANGGGGSTGGGAKDGEPGKLSSNQAFGVVGTSGYGYGGDGGHGMAPNGGNGTDATGSAAGGAGGGAVGRIRINNRSASFTPTAPSNISPALGILTDAPSSVGPLDIH